MITYNHEKYIKQAIESILMQECNFDYEIVIGEDASTDNTRKIILELKNKFPAKFILLLHNENVGMMNNFVGVLQKAKGKYIALLEGDDYWTDSLKLQKQVDFLEANPGFGLVSSYINCIDEKNIKIETHPYNLSKTHKNYEEVFWTLMRKNFIYTLTVCVRTDLMQVLINRIVERKLTYPYDYWFWLHISIVSKIKIFEYSTACYRIHENGISRKTGFFDNIKILVKVDSIKTYLRYKNGKLNREQKKVVSHTLKNLLKNNEIKIRTKISFLFFLMQRIIRLI